jgi:hypothetical protein
MAPHISVSLCLNPDEQTGAAAAVQLAETFFQATFRQGKAAKNLRLCRDPIALIIDGAFRLPDNSF